MLPKQEEYQTLLEAVETLDKRIAQLKILRSYTQQRAQFVDALIQHEAVDNLLPTNGQVIIDFQYRTRLEDLTKELDSSSEMTVWFIGREYDQKRINKALALYDILYPK